MLARRRAWEAVSASIFYPVQFFNIFMSLCKESYKSKIKRLWLALREDFAYSILSDVFSLSQPKLSRAQKDHRHLTVGDRYYNRNYLRHHAHVRISVTHTQRAQFTTAPKTVASSRSAWRVAALIWQMETATWGEIYVLGCLGQAIHECTMLAWRNKTTFTKDWNYSETEEKKNMALSW